MSLPLSSSFVFHSLWVLLYPLISCPGYFNLLISLSAVLHLVHCYHKNVSQICNPESVLLLLVNLLWIPIAHRVALKCLSWEGYTSQLISASVASLTSCFSLFHVLHASQTCPALLLNLSLLLLKLTHLLIMGHPIPHLLSLKSHPFFKMRLKFHLHHPAFLDSPNWIISSFYFAEMTV